jgi:hypothetical protein
MVMTYVRLHRCVGPDFWTGSHKAKATLYSTASHSHPGSQAGSSTTQKPAAPTDTAADAGAPQTAATGNADPMHLIGLDEGQLKARFGAPATEEDQSPGKTLRYRNRRCTLSLALYPDVQTRVFRALSYEVTSDDHSATGTRHCLAELESRSHSR